MANLFRQVGIYSSVGQGYEPEDIGSVLSYREVRDGQIPASRAVTGSSLDSAICGRS
jgi:pyruvate dehydrogenase E1 component